jgi:hypothetical protein
MTGDVFAQAYNVVQSVDGIVGGRIRDAAATADSLQTNALISLQALQNVNFNFSGGALPSPPRIDPEIEIEIDLPPIVATSFGAITSTMPSRPSLIPAPNLPALNIPRFTSSIGSLNIPAAPAWSAPADAPQRPDVGDVTLPPAPTIVLPTAPTLVEINPPTFAGLALPVFSAQAPEFVGTALPGILQWVEPTYHTEILDEVLGVILCGRVARASHRRSSWRW